MSTSPLLDTPYLTEHLPSTSSSTYPARHNMSLSMNDLADMAASVQRSHPHPSPSRDDQNRRSACDRCRKQKLRCERRPSATAMDPCKRCLKSRSRCVTGPSLPMGRPKIRTRSASPFDYRAVKRDYQALVSDFGPHVGRISKGRTPPPPPPPQVSSIDIGPLAEIPCTNMGAMSVLAHGTMPQIQADHEQKYVADCGYNDYQTSCSSTSNTVVPAERTGWDETIRALQELNLRLLKMCHSLNMGNTGGQWSYGDHTSLNPYGPYLGGGFQSQLGSVVSADGLLESSNEFLKIAQDLLFAHPNITPMSSRQSSVDYGGLGYGAMGYQRMHSSSVGYAPHPGAIYDDRESEFSPSSIPSLTSSVSTAATPSAPRPLDYPTLMALFTSYTTLLRMHRTVLTRMHLALLSQPMPWSFLESVLPGLYPDGLAAEQQPEGQVRLFAQLVRKSLEQMERSVGYAAKLFSCGLEPGMGAKLLDAMVRAEAAEGAAARVVSPHTLVDEVLRTIDGIMGGM